MYWYMEDQVHMYVTHTLGTLNVERMSAGLVLVILIGLKTLVITLFR